MNKTIIRTLTVLTTVLMLAPLVALYANENDAPIVGAIRWDGWTGKGGVVKQMEHSLGQPKYHFRLPWFAQVTGVDKVSINGDSQEIIEKEIDYAAEAGLDYWAFVDYWDQSADLSIALERYRAAKDKRGVRYCFVEEGSRMDTIGTNGFGRLVEHFKDPHYQTVLEGRPLLFVFVKTTKLGKPAWDELKRQTLAAGLKAPYLVLMGWNPAQDEKDRVALGFDAVSAYARGGSYSMTQPSYAEQCALIRRDRWGKWRDLRIPSVTFVSAGWDTRPRNERPPSWMHGVHATPDPTPPEQQKPLIDGVTATPEELAAHLREALEWTKQNRDINPSQAIIIYAWNEHDEGGWLSPTWTPEGKPNTARLDALRSVLKPLKTVSNETWQVTNSVLAVTTSARDGGAVCSLVYRGKELVNDFDHGRQLQVAWSYNDADEAYNPTEAGSDRDGKGAQSTSQLISARVESNTVRTVSHPAYWRHTSLPEQYRKNTALVTKDTLFKQITVGYQGDPHVLVFDTQITLSPELTGPQMTSLRIEAPTLYASRDLNCHFLLDPSDGKLTRVPILSQTKNQMNTVINQVTRREHVPIMSTADEQYAVAFYSSEQVNFWSYFTWDVPSDDPVFACSKITAFFKHPAAAGQSYAYRTWVIVGDLATVKTSIQKLYGQQSKKLQAGVIPAFTNDVAADQWLRKQSPSYLRMATYVDGKWGTEFGIATNSPGGLAYLKDGRGHIDLNETLKGAHRVSVIVFEMTNLYQQERHEEITAPVRRGELQDATKFALLREAVEYDGLRLHREVLVELEQKVGELPPEMIRWVSSTATNLSSYALPYAYDYFKAQAKGGHTEHYYRLFKKHTAEAKQVRDIAVPSK